jgi:hypothetical protein
MPPRTENITDGSGYEVSKQCAWRKFAQKVMYRAAISCRSIILPPAKTTIPGGRTRYIKRIMWLTEANGRA